MHDNKIILDTCALIWLVSGNKIFSSTALNLIEKSPIVYVSAISAWEISLKEAQKSIELPLNTKEWFLLAVKKHNLKVYPLDIDILISANNLPWHHRDPADRFIIATALKEKATIVTADTKFSMYDVKIVI